MEALWKRTGLGKRPAIIKEAFKFIHRLKKTKVDSDMVINLSVHLEKPADAEKKSYAAYRDFFEAYETKSLVAIYRAWKIYVKELQIN